jgi:cytochrome c oxidase subunit 5a
MSASAKEESDAEFDARYETFFNRKDIDGWEIRKGMQDLVGQDMVPDPIIVASALRACRRVNDYSLTTRIIEIVKIKCGNREAEIWPYMLQVRPLQVLDRVSTFLRYNPLKR